MACFIFVVSGDGSCHRPESRSASVERAGVVIRLMDKDMSVGSWLKILHLATNTATSFLQIGSHNFSYMCLWVLVAGARYGERHTSPYRALRPWGRSGIDDGHGGARPTSLVGRKERGCGQITKRGAEAKMAHEW